MSKTIKINQVKENVGELVTLQGWVYNLRCSAKVAFPIIRDGSGLLQCVAVQKSLPEETFEVLRGLTVESSVTVTGTIRAEQRAPGGFEMDIEGVNVLQRVPETDPYPITPKDHPLDFLLDNRHLWIRSRRQTAVLRIRHTIVNAVHSFLDKKGFTLVNAPVLSNLAFVGDSSAFKVDSKEVFGEKSFLSQSAQPYLEAAAMALGKVYSLGPVFSAEDNKTRRHLAEFWLAELEMPFANVEWASLFSENLVGVIIEAVLNANEEDLKRLERMPKDLDYILTEPHWPRLNYDLAIDQVQAARSDTQQGMSFSIMDQTLLTRDLLTPLIVEHPPFSATDRRFLQADSERPEAALGFSMLAPQGYGEIISGGQRICDYAKLVEQLSEGDLLSGWYADLRKYGNVPHAGFSMHIERMVSWVCGLEHIREATLFPRMVGRLKP